MAEADLGGIRELVRSVVRPAIHPDRIPFEVAAFHVGGEPISFIEALDRSFQPFQIGEKWGPRWDTTWFRLRGAIPPGWVGQNVEALVHLGGDEVVGFSAEGLIWDPSGIPLQGLHHRHRSYPVAAVPAGGMDVELYVEAAANPIPPWPRADWPRLEPDYDGEPMYVLGQAELAMVDRDIEALYLDLRLLIDMAIRVPDRAEGARFALQAAAAAIDPADVAGSAPAARSALQPVLASGAAAAGRHVVTAVGHAHIDTAWLWPLRETSRKCARTFANQLRLMERYPEHRFACSQAVQYQWIKDRYPQLYQQIKQRVAEGRWEPVGGMWVEPDCNLPSGEALVRQFVYGKRFFVDEFGIETAEMWIPDVFGYPAALPQIARACGVTSLITQKMSWNDVNPFPHSTFWWEGHDGSRVLAHFPPADTYNGDFTPGEIEHSQVAFKDHARSERSLYPFGYGDGGGGPTAAMLENARRLQDVAGWPQVEIGCVGPWLDRVRAESPDLTTWVGELYLEKHRGTYTSHADVKLANRRGEETLRAAELWSVAAALDRAAELDEAWKLLLVNQFHDILPGSSINWVYEDSARDHARVLDLAGDVVSVAQAQLAGAGPDPVAFNAASADRTEVVELPGQEGLSVAHVPACGWARVEPGTGGLAPVEVGDGFIDNGVLRVEWDTDGLLTSVRDLEVGREVLAAGARGNVFQLHEDNPRHFDAWEVEIEYLDQVQDLTDVDTIEICEHDALRAGVRMVRRFGSSNLNQTMRLAAGSRRLEFHTEADWHENHRFLKVAFPVAVRSPRATYEIQHGYVERPTVANTSWDEARFEVCAHRWADLSESGYGVALLNDCKYGYDIRGHVMRLSLLRAPGYPDPLADRGRHRFAYALLPHPGDWREGGRVVQEAEAFNLPLSVVSGRGSGQVVSVDRPGVSVEAVKRADRAPGVIVRLCEVWGSRGPVRVTLHHPFEAVSRTDLLERDLEPLAARNGGVDLELRPFELVTLKFH